MFGRLLSFDLALKRDYFKSFFFQTHPGKLPLRKPIEMKRLIPLFFLSTILNAPALNGQNFEVPENYYFNSKEDYARYEKDIVAAAKWLHVTPFNEQKEKRKEVSAFVVKWINGSPTVNVEINPTIMDFEEKKPGMLDLYMAGC